MCLTSLITGVIQEHFLINLDGLKNKFLVCFSEIADQIILGFFQEAIYVFFFEKVLVDARKLRILLRAEHFKVISQISEFFERVELAKLVSLKFFDH